MLAYLHALNWHRWAGDHGIALPHPQLLTSPTAEPAQLLPLEAIIKVKNYFYYNLPFLTRIFRKNSLFCSNFFHALSLEANWELMDK